MQVEHDNFVGIYDGAFSNEYCDSLIKHFEWCNNNNRSFGRPESQHIKSDVSTALNPSNTVEINYMSQNISEYISEFNRGFWDICYADYLKVYGVLAESAKHTIYTYKIQRTMQGGGYHVWHCEDGDKAYSGRLGVYILYLNDVDEGGETEFLYLSKRIKAKKGRLVIFPPNYPWAHRGNPPLSGTKYILTGWMEFS
jgi:hypothetical protein